MISVRNLSFSYGPTLVFEQASFVVPQGWKVGLSGPNGAGKTTLLKLIAGQDSPDKGKLEVVGKVAWVPQEVQLDEELEKSKTVRDYLFKQGYQLKQILTGLELRHLDLEDSPKKLSGGQKTRLALAKALLSDAQILLLDEPTNFLDVVGKKWVMSFLGKTTKTVLIISHDLDLLDKNIDKVLAINSQTKKVEEYKGNYSAYLKLKKEADALLTRQVLNQQKKIKKMAESVGKLWSNTSTGGVRQRVILQRRLERLKTSLPELPASIQKIKLKLPDPLWVGEIPIKAKDICKAFAGKSVLTDINFYITRGEKLALIGPNGAGKSTLIKILTAELQPDSGEIIKDDRLSLGYYSQEFDSLDLRKTVYDTIKEIYPQPESVIRPYLAKFLFLGDRVYQNVSSLSGGEKTRLSIAKLLIHSYNLLILDEPTTYLDMLSQRVILEALKEYRGAVIIVSHTEDFIKGLQPKRALFLPENEIKYWDDCLLEKVNEV